MLPEKDAAELRGPRLYSCVIAGIVKILLVSGILYYSLSSG